MSPTIDDEWSQYLLSQQLNNYAGNKYGNYLNGDNVEKQSAVSLKDKSEYLIIKSSIENVNPEELIVSAQLPEDCKMEASNIPNEVPKCDDLYISTKTKVLFLNQIIDIHSIFWHIPIIEYWKPCPGVVKKQMKIISKNIDEYNEYRAKLEDVKYYKEHIIKQINNPNARRIKFKDERKITVGVSKKDIMNCHGKIKNAFYNCFAMILRFKYETSFREIHVKVFNTGKLEIPGILNSKLLDIVKEMILQILQPNIRSSLKYIDNDKNDNVLINSNFNCGFYIDREILSSILKSEKYGIETSFDPCSYPGVKCKFYFNNECEFDKSVQDGKINTKDRSMKMSELFENKKYTEVSFMIFRTGSCLIVGNCSEQILLYIFEFVKNILTVEYNKICVHTNETYVKTKKAKLRKKTVNISDNYYNDIITK